jgi:DNA-binding NtrC family response regulator
MKTYLLTKNDCNLSSNMKSMDHETSTPPSWNHKTILIVDDHIDVLITIKSMLQTCGYAVNAFNDPLLALEHFIRMTTLIVISDMILPSMSGLEFIKKVRSVNPETVTFVITASDNIKDFDKNMLYDSTLIELDGIIRKPILLDDLCRLVGRKQN